MSFLKKLIFLGVLLTLGGTALGSGNDFQAPQPGRVFKFPRDHGAHPKFKTEWWYWTGHLISASGESFGYQLTFFRAALRKPDPQARSAWSFHTVYFAHLAVSDIRGRRFVFREKAGREALGLSGARTETLKVWIDSWQAEMQGEDFYLSARDGDLGLNLVLTPRKPPILHGENGLSRKAANHPGASHYYSLTRLDTRGRITVAGRDLDVKGESWMDHEFFTGAPAPDQVGWDWFALQLDDGGEVMLYLLRRQDGTPDAASSGTYIDPQGRPRHLHPADFQVKTAGYWKSPHNGAKYPGGWEIVIPALGYRLNLTPSLADQEIRAQVPARLAYWEGQVAIQGGKNQQPVSGKGYVELTGYAGPMRGWF